MLFSTNAFASSADSGICPWKMPFTITINGIGTSHGSQISRQPVAGGYYEHDTDYGIQSSNAGLNIDVDTMDNQVGFSTSDYLYSISYSIQGDILDCSIGISPKSSSAYPVYKNSFVEIKFSPGTDSIISLTCSEVDSTHINNQLGIISIVSKLAVFVSMTLQFLLQIRLLVSIRYYSLMSQSMMNSNRLRIFIHP